jgi:energy-coupling factor transporter ATP-binding protein EcfA2
VQVDADVLLVDEVLAVGDAAFQQKCHDEFRRMKREGRTILFVTHDMAAVELFCDRALLLERGAIADLGDPVGIGRGYREINFRRGEEVRVGEERFGSRREAEIVSLWLEHDGERVEALAAGDEATLVLEIWTREPVEEPVISFTLRNRDGVAVFAPTTQFEPALQTTLAAERRYLVRLDWSCLLAPGRYEVSPSLTRGGRPDDMIDLRESFATVVVHSSKPQLAVADLPHRFTVEPA